MEAVISALWITGTVVSWAAVVGLVGWVIGWGARFKFWQTQEGLILWSFSAMLLLLVLNNIFGALGATTRQWWQPMPNEFIWWYFTRAAINISIFVVITSMLRILAQHWRNGTSINFTVEARPLREPRPKTGPTPTS